MCRQTVVQKLIFNGKYTVYHSNYDKSGDSKTFVATIVANMATERMRLDTTALNYPQSVVKLVRRNLGDELLNLPIDFLKYECSNLWPRTQAQCNTHITILSLFNPQM